jgi:hypothetical protein
VCGGSYGQWRDRSGGRHNMVASWAELTRDTVMFQGQRRDYAMAGDCLVKIMFQSPKTP